MIGKEEKEFLFNMGKKDSITGFFMPFDYDVSDRDSLEKSTAYLLGYGSSGRPLPPPKPSSELPINRFDTDLYSKKF